jgi:D-alanyl-D-alanine carboxypeptidase/D-alanyl-D-alanine-endopeptidase (penicillin-binding protein 4)
VIDLRLTPAAKAGDAAAFVSAPQTSYVKFISHVTTGPAASKSDLDISDPVANPDGTISIIITGNVPLGSQPTTAAFAVPSPTTFAQTVLVEALSAAGV